MTDAILKLTVCVGSMLALAACTTSTVVKTGELSSVETLDAEKPLFTINKVKSNGADGEQICKSQAVTGSKFKRKLCATQEEWDKLAEDNQAALTDLKRKTQKHN